MAIALVPSVRTQVLVGGLKAPLPIDRWDVTQAAYGAAGTISLTTSMSLADSLGIDLVALAQKTTAVPVDVYVGRVADPTRWRATELARVFSGYLDLSKHTFHTDTLTVTGRDASSLLMDQQIITNFENLTPDQIATKFANDAGLMPVVTKVVDQHGQPVLAGHYYQLDTIHMGLIPRQKWDLLLYLARSVGFDVYVTPNRELVFAPPPSATPTPLVYWWRNPQAPATQALLEVEITHSPRRNNTFKVLVLSYHPKQVVPTVGTMVVLGETFQIPGEKTLAAGTYRGQGVPGSAIYNVLSKAVEGKPIYQFHVQGLTAQQAQDRAEAIAIDIMKHEFVADFTVDGAAAITSRSVVQLRGLGHGFDTKPFYPSRVQHTFELPEAGAADSRGWLTQVSALNIPPSAVDDPSLAIQG